MGTLNWQGEEYLAQTDTAIRGGLEDAGPDLVSSLQRLNRERAYDTGEMTEGWGDDGVTQNGDVFTLTAGNDVEHTVYQDQGTSRIPAQNISGSALDEIGPTIPGRIASRMP